MPPVGLEPTISAGERLQTYTLDRAAAGMINMYRSIMLLIIVHWCETWSVILRKERWLGMARRGILRKRFGSGEEEERDWRKLRSEGFHYSYPPRNTVSVHMKRR